MKTGLSYFKTKSIIVFEAASLRNNRRPFSRCLPRSPRCLMVADSSYFSWMILSILESAEV
jgi:hypothetical protein